MCARLRLPNVELNRIDQEEGIVETYAEHKVRTVKLRAAFAVGAAAVAGAFGVGYVLAEALDQANPTAVAQPVAAAEHALSDAAAESLVLKQRMPVRGKAADIRYRRVE